MRAGLRVDPDVIEDLSDLRALARGGWLGLPRGRLCHHTKVAVPVHTRWWHQRRNAGYQLHLIITNLDV